MENWLKQWKENYEGRSKEHKDLEPFLKENYKGNIYIPWATMERLAIMQDPNFTFEVIKEESGYKSSYITRHEYVIRQESKTGDKEVSSESLNFAHIIVCKATFLGKTMLEYYPIQDNAYNAPKVIDANMFNKAVQRAKAKLISRITGLGFSLYEKGDLQFDAPEDKVKPEKPTKVKTEETTKVKTEETKETNIDVSSVPNVPNDIEEIAKYIHKNEQLNSGFVAINTTVQKKYGFIFDINESVEEIKEKLSHIADPKTFIKAVKARSNILG